MINSVSKLFSYNYSLFCAFFAWGLAQFLKIIFTYFNDKKFNIELLFSSGGMPSAHSAAVTALASSIGIKYGINSPLFSIATILAAIVMYDSSGVRRSSGEQAKLLNKIVENLQIEELKKEKLNKKTKILNKSKNCNKNGNEIKILKEQLGHTTIEVFAGALVGLLVVVTVPF